MRGVLHLKAIEGHLLFFEGDLLCSEDEGDLLCHEGALLFHSLQLLTPLDHWSVNCDQVWDEVP